MQAPHNIISPFNLAPHAVKLPVAGNLLNLKFSESRLSGSSLDSPFKINLPSPRSGLGAVPRPCDQSGPSAVTALDVSFLQWLAGFTDAEGNFNISLRQLNGNHYHSVLLTFQIGLHIDDLPVLKYINNTLQCGHISVSGNRCNFFVNDHHSLTNVVLPIFNHISLNSSKYFQFLIFQKAVNLLSNKSHLTEQGKTFMFQYYQEMRSFNSQHLQYPHPNIIISDFWLGGFIDGDATFSTNKAKPRLKFENHHKELELFKKIHEYFNNKGSLILTKPRKSLLNSVPRQPTVVLDFHQLDFLINVIVPLFQSKPLLKTRKNEDFFYWAILVNIYFLGYHLLPETQSLIKEIKLKMNKFRLSTHPSNQVNNFLIDDNSLTSKILQLFETPPQYTINNGIRLIKKQTSESQ